ncbi:RDD family protein [Cellulosimicrobium marinum]|uniref:RDD family protein n=1 Tax=Cellulosimicrobium marinum TaxID=1638992 RepID=UPI001E2D6965|nr:RDD family protein [Cellulosimicrobium marinum]MCB7135560.1 RDD family protein [Cellulosimicrobium marinum]
MTRGGLTDDVIRDVPDARADLTLQRLGSGTGSGTGSGLVYAGWAQRVLAHLLDAAIVSAVTFLALGPVGGFSMLPSFTLGPSTTVDVTLTDSGWLLATVVAGLVLQAYTGSTPGKRTVGIVVVREETGRPAGLVSTVLRQLAHVLDAILLVGFLRPLWHPQRKTFADSLLGTVVLSTTRPPVPHPWVAALVRSARALRPVPDDAPPPPGRRASAAVTAGATLLCVTAAAFALTPGTVTQDDLWQESCTPLVEPGASDAPLVAESVGVVSWATGVTETRWGVSRTRPPEAAPDDAGLEVLYTVLPAADAAPEVPVEAELVLTVHDADGNLREDRGSQIEVTPHADGSVDHVLVAGTPGADVESIRLPASQTVDLEPGWRWEASVRVDGSTIASCGGRGPA